MTNKAYIVANEQQEREVLETFEREGYLWIDGVNKPTKLVPRKKHGDIFPYAIITDDFVSWKFLSQLKDEEIVYDGRKEEKMSDKYVVSQEFMNGLKKWNTTAPLDEQLPFSGDDMVFPEPISSWWIDVGISVKESNNRLIAIIRWVNGEDVFEVEKPKKWVVRSKDIDGEGDYGYIFINPYNITISTYSISQATRFETKEEAESWANSHQEVIEVEE